MCCHQGGSLSVASTRLNHPEFHLFSFCVIFAHFWRVANKTGGFVISRLPPRPQSDSAVYFANNENYNCTIAKSPHHFQVSLWRDNQQSFRIRKYVDFTVSTKKRILTWPVQWNKIWIPDLKMNSMTLAWEAASTVLTVFTTQIADTMNWGARICIPNISIYPTLAKDWIALCADQIIYLQGV